jgi:hypothetical protein
MTDEAVSRGRRRRGYEPLRLGVITIAVVMCLAVAACSSSPADAGNTQRVLSLAPGCGGPPVSMVDMSGDTVTTVSATVGKTVQISAHAAGGDGVTLVSGILAIGQPGAVLTGIGAAMTAHAAEAPANQVATSTALVATATASLSFNPAKSGTYPVIFMGKYTDCTGDSAPASFETQIGSITVK